MAEGLSADVVRRIVARLSLWDARSLQLAHPGFVPVVSDVVEEWVRRAREAPCPALVDRFLNTRPGFQERVNGGFTLLRTPRDVSMQCAHERVVVSLRLRHDRGTARVEIRVLDGAPRPTFPTMQRALSAMWWYAGALARRGVPRVEFRTRAATHCPTSEVLNTLAHKFVDTHLEPLIQPIKR